MTCICMSVTDACRAIGIGKTTFYSLVAANRITPVKIGRRTLIPVSALQDLIRGEAA